jgi:hypothetical protein
MVTSPRHHGVCRLVRQRLKAGMNFLHQFSEAFGEQSVPPEAPLSREALQDS